MRPPEGMREVSLQLSKKQAAEHQLAAGVVQAIVFEGKGDGWVTNHWPNRHLSGLIVQKRRRETVHGRIWTNEFVPLDNVLPQVEAVEESIAAESERIEGREDETGMHQPGELEKLSAARIQLTDWLTLTPDEKQELKDYFARVAGDRARAVNPLNVGIGARAARMQELKDRLGRDNPSAIRVMSYPLERDLAERHRQLGRKMGINDSRAARLHQWIRAENQHVGRCIELLEDLVRHQRDDDLYSLIGEAYHIRFRVQPLNQLAHAISETGRRIEDVSVAEIALGGMYFMRYKSYILNAFRRLYRAGNPKADRTPIEAIEERLVALLSMDVEGPYRRLVGRLVPIGEAVVNALEDRDRHAAGESARDFKRLMHYHCLPGDPEDEAAVWYRHTL